MGKKKHPGGRPSKYTPALQEKFDRKVNEWNPLDETKPADKIKKFFEFCIVQQVALLLGVHSDQVNEYTKRYPQFYVTKKKWQDKRDAFWMSLAPYFIKTPVLKIWYDRNWLGYVDKPVESSPSDSSLDELNSKLAESRKRRNNGV